ncbi:MAG: low temperature requirement protein A, partial [Acidimicrobiia bacterium]|nr:low temperature requirement protein A [Acidimicrobiia bacterium]
MNEDRSASFVELFFDLVFVFAVTQVVASIHGHLDWSTLGRAAIVLTLMWWAWTQFTWTAGNADFDELQPRIVLLVATAGTFVLATAIQGAFEDDGGTFALAYFGLMSLFAVFYMFLVMGTDQMAGFVAYAPRVMAGSVLVLIGGFASEDLRPWIWLAAVVINFVSTLAVDSNEYEINASHFAERHGLFVIIVLGEGLIAIGVGLVGQATSMTFYIAGTAMLLTVLAMWWSYFDWLFRIGEKALKAATGIARGRLARDAYSIAHLPIVAGVILFAVGTEELLAHPELSPDAGSRWAFLGGLMLFVAAQSFMARRFTGSLTFERFALMGVLGLAGLVLGDLNGATLGA